MGSSSLPSLLPSLPLPSSLRPPLRRSGNTCFMNSMLQCLSNLKPLRDFFIDGSFEKSLNEDNPLGTKGELAAAFASLLKLMWGNSASIISPRSFKAILGRHAPQFSGYSQHDSQELCYYVLDKLHEDVNSVRRKPYVENFEANGEPDAEIIAEVRKRHRLRNHSRIGDMFEGFYKSTVVCPACERVSVTFDPYMSVSLPLGAQDNKRNVIVSMRRIDLSITQLTLTLPSTAKMGALVEAAAQASEIPASRLVAVEVFNNRFHHFFDNGEPVERLFDSEDIVFVYETHHARAFSSQQACRAVISHTPQLNHLLPSPGFTSLPALSSTSIDNIRIFSLPWLDCISPVPPFSHPLLSPHPLINPSRAIH